MHDMRACPILLRFWQIARIQAYCTFLPAAWAEPLLNNFFYIHLFFINLGVLNSNRSKNILYSVREWRWTNVDKLFYNTSDFKLFENNLLMWRFNHSDRQIS